MGRSQQRGNNMINQTRSKQSWNIGDTVKVGFMRLKVVSVRAEKDWKPDIYTLESLDGSKRYEFIPHYGLSRVDDPGIPCGNMNQFDKVMRGF